MSETFPNEETAVEFEEEDDEGYGEEQDIEPTPGNSKVFLPKDGYEWKKYGQKFIKNIGKFRSYFKCQRRDCSAKKRVEWLASEEPSKTNIRVVYKGVHTHVADNHASSSSMSQGSTSTTTSSSSNPNQYNLLTQILNSRNQSSE